MPPGRPDRSRERPRLPPTILFDLDDTLFDHRFAARGALAHLRRHEPFLQRLPLARVAAEYFRTLEELHPEVLAGRLSKGAARAERFRRLAALAGESIGAQDSARLARAYREQYQRLRRAVPGAGPLLRRLHEESRIGIVTNNEVAEQEEKLRFIGLWPTVDALVISQAVGVSKPDPRIFRLALRELRASPRDAVMVGDSWTNDVRGARAARIRPVWFNRFGAARPEPLRVAELSSWRPRAFVDRALGGVRARADRGSRRR